MPTHSLPFTRRRLLSSTGGGLLALGAAPSLVTTAAAQGAGGGETPPALKMPRLYVPSEREGTDPPLPAPPGERVGFAVLGLGRLSLEQILPALGQAKHAKLAALVSGSPDKLRAAGERYGVPQGGLYDYANFDRIRDNPDVQVVYVVLPNSMHREFTERAAGAGKHVLSEKPMATSVADAEAMVRACAAANVKLMVAYRMQYEPHLRETIRLARSGELGRLKSFTSENCQTQGDPGQWRLKRALAGGGALPDIGLYCLNTARAVIGEEPIEVMARVHSTPDDPRFKEVEEAVAFTLAFPSGVIANCFTSYDVHNSRRLRMGLSDGFIDMDPAYSYEGQRLRVGRKNPNNAKVEDDDELRLEHKNQFALEMDHMAQCVKRNLRPHTPGEEGVQDQRLMEAIYASAREGRPVRLDPVPGRDPFRGPPPEG